MSKYALCFLASASAFTLVCCAYTLRADEPKAENARPDALMGEVIVIESKSGSTVAIEHARTRVIGGQSFIGGDTLLDDSLPDSSEFAGSRIWISVGEIGRIIEFDTKAQAIERYKIHTLLKRQADLAKQLLSPQPAVRQNYLNQELKTVKKLIMAIESASKGTPSD